MASVNDKKEQACSNKFAQPASLEELGLTDRIETFLGEYLNKFGHYCEFYTDCIANHFYNWLYSPKNHQNGVKSISKDKSRLMKEYATDLENNISSEQKRILENKFNGSNASKETQAGFLWAFYPDSSHSCAALYEKNLKKEIAEVMEYMISYWDFDDGKIDYGTALKEKINFKRTRSLLR
jgi:hypothetical protein